MGRPTIFVLGVFILTAVAGAQVGWSGQKSDKDPAPELQSSLTSDAEFQDDLRASGIPIEARCKPSSAIANAFGASEEVTYYDDEWKINNFHHLFGADPVSVFNNSTFSNDRSSEFFFCKQLEVQKLLLRQGASDERTSCDPSVDRDCKYGREYLKKFSQNGFLDPKKQKSDSDSALQSAFQNLVAGTIQGDAFVQAAFKYPKAFPALPALLKQARAQNNKQAIQAIQTAISGALLLTLDATVPTADSNNDVYPYFDRVCLASTDLPVDRLFEKLSSMHQWPETRDLTEEQRNALGGVYHDTSTGGRWLVKGFYDEAANQIWLDLENDFYENVLSYYHELWHVAWSRSVDNRTQIDGILQILQEPDSPTNQQQLRTAVLSQISENEFRALQQQIQLFHALGAQMGEWDGQTLSSALHWHDAYLGSEAAGTFIDKKNRISSFFGSLMESPVQKTEGQEYGVMYFNSQIEAHSKLFEERYFGQVLNVTHKMLPIDTTGWVNTLGEIYVPKLSCSDISRIRAALGSNWKFGFPLIHTLSDPQNCPDEPLGPDFPSTDGSHTDVIPTALVKASSPATVNVTGAVANGPVSAPSTMNNGTTPALAPSSFSASQLSTLKLTIGFPSLEGPDEP